MKNDSMVFEIDSDCAREWKGESKSQGDGWDVDFGD